MRAVETVAALSILVAALTLLTSNYLVIAQTVSIGQVRSTANLTISQGADGKWRGFLSISLLNMAQVTVHAPWMQVSLSSVQYVDKTTDNLGIQAKFEINVAIDPQVNYPLQPLTFTSAGFDKQPQSFTYEVDIYIQEASDSIRIYPGVPIPEFPAAQLSALLGITAALLLTKRCSGKVRSPRYQGC